MLVVGKCYSAAYLLYDSLLHKTKAATSSRHRLYAALAIEDAQS